MKKNKRFQVRQGDVLVTVCDSIPQDCKPVKRDNGQVILAYGEVTGHCHAIAEPNVALMEREGTMYLSVTAPKGAKLTHQEHTTTTIPPGTYTVKRQREYARGEVRQVLD